MIDYIRATGKRSFSRGGYIITVYLSTRRIRVIRFSVFAKRIEKRQRYRKQRKRQIQNFRRSDRKYRGPSERRATGVRVRAGTETIMFRSLRLLRAMFLPAGERITAVRAQNATAVDTVAARRPRSRTGTTDLMAAGGRGTVTSTGRRPRSLTVSRDAVSAAS